MALSSTPRPALSAAADRRSQIAVSSEGNEDHNGNETNIKSDTHQIDEQGDLLLVVTAGPRIRDEYNVDSRALARSSEFWNKLIRESPRPGGQEKQNLKADGMPQHQVHSSPCAVALSPANSRPDSLQRFISRCAVEQHRAGEASYEGSNNSRTRNQSLDREPGPSYPPSNALDRFLLNSQALNHSSRRTSDMLTTASALSGRSSHVTKMPVTIPSTTTHVVQPPPGSRLVGFNPDCILPVSQTSDSATQTAHSNAESNETISTPILHHWTVSLDLADQKAHVAQLRTLLYAAHGRLDRMPTQPTLGELCSVLVLANRCEMMPIMRGHIHTWLGMSTAMSANDDGAHNGGGRAFNGKRKSAGIHPGLFTQLRTDWEAGNQHEFQKRLATLAWHTQMGDSGELASIRQNEQTSWPIVREEVVGVADIMDTIRAHRLGIITLALDLLRQRLQLLQSPTKRLKRKIEQSTGEEGPEPANGKERRACALGKPTDPDCDAFYYGLLVQELNRQRINPHRLPEPSAVKKSPHALCAILETVYDAIDARMQQAQGRTSSGAGRSGGEKKVHLFLAGHENCNPLAPVIVHIKNQRDKDPAALTEAQITHFQEQMQKMGKMYGTA